MLPRKIALYTSSHFTPIEAWRSSVSTTWEGRRVSSHARLENCMQVWGWAKFGERATHGWGKIPVHTFSHLSKPVWTCPHYSDYVRSLHNVIFLHFQVLLFFGLTSYPAEIAYLNSPNPELSKSVRVMALYWSKTVDPSRSPCLKIVDEKSYERGDFCLTSSPTEKCIFQLSKSTAFHRRTARGDGLKKNCRP